MAFYEILLIVTVIVLIIWNFFQQGALWNADIEIGTLQRKSDRFERHIKLNEESAHEAKGDVKILAEKLGLYFDTIPSQESKRVLRKHKNDEIVDQKLDFNFEIDKEED